MAIPEFALAQASPFDTGANNLVQNLITIGFPVAVILVMGLGIAAIAGQISWGWALGAVIGIGIFFAAQPIVTWVRGLFGA
jgi:type IV secretory pathway VirB2 component (pilin)